MKVYFIRHTSVKVAEGVCYGRSDVPLNDSFEEEAAETLAEIKNINFDKVYTSPLGRAVKLATYCGFPKAEQDPRLMELDFGDWEMQKFDDIKEIDHETWFKDYLKIKPTNGESYQDMAARVASFITELRQQPYENVAVFCHGGTILCAQVYAGLIKQEGMFEHITPYGGVVEIDL